MSAIHVRLPELDTATSLAVAIDRVSPRTFLKPERHTPDWRVEASADSADAVRIIEGWVEDEQVPWVSVHVDGIRQMVISRSYEPHGSLARRLRSR